jgi:VCBS repeat-containing protein
VDAGSYTVGITGTTGGNYEALNTTDTATVTVTDTINTVTFKIIAVDVNGVQIGDGSVNSAAEGLQTYYKVIALDPSNNVISNPAGSVGITFTTGTAGSGDFNSTTSTIAVGQVFSANLVDDTVDENSENFTVRITPNSATNIATYENVVLSTNIVTTTINDNDNAPIVSSVVSDDDHVLLNTDTNTGNNVVQTGTIQNIGATDVISISGLTSGITSGGNAVSYSWDAGTKILTGTSSSGTVFTLVVNSNNTGYTFTQLKAIDHLATVQGEGDSKVLNFGLSVAGGISTASFSATVYDDIPVTYNASNSIYIGVDTLSLNSLKAGFTNDTYDNGTSTVTRTNTDSDTYNDKIEWGTPASNGGSKSGYALVDNTTYTGTSGAVVQMGTGFKLADFSHNNFPINSGSSILNYTDMTLTANVVINGITTPITMTVRLEHTETPNNGADPRDIITLPAQQTIVNINGQKYTINLEGFKDSGGNIVNTIYTDENASNPFGIWGSITTTELLPTVTGHVLGEAGADGSVSNIVWNNTTSTYGTFVGNADGTYTFTLNDATRNAMQAGTMNTATFSYSVTDKDGDISTSTLSIQIGGYQNKEGTSAADTLTGTAGNDMILGFGGNDTLNGATGSNGNDYLDGGIGADTVRGGSGNDIIVFDANDTLMDGGISGTDKDTLILSTGTNIDFTALADSKIKNIEVIDLHQNGNHNLTKITLTDVIQMTESKQLYILGDKGDNVDFDGTGWAKGTTPVTETVNGSSHTFDVYINSTDSTVMVKVEQAITDTI